MVLKGVLLQFHPRVTEIAPSGRRTMATCYRCERPIPGDGIFCAYCSSRPDSSYQPGDDVSYGSGYRESGIGGKQKVWGVVLAVLFGFWGFLYTYRRDAARFWVCLAVIVVLGVTTILGGYLAAFVTWIYAIITMSTRSQDWFLSY